MPTTTGMRGEGFYDTHSSPQWEALAAFLPWLEEAIGRIPLPQGDNACFRLLDIGSSEGANATRAAGRLIQAVRRRSDLPIEVGFDDLPSNNFNQLFLNLFPQGSWRFDGAGEVYATVVAGSAFARLRPGGSLQVATTFNAIGFLERQPPTPVSHYVLAMPPGPCSPRSGVGVPEAATAAYQAEAARNLRAFYAARAAELAPGGALLVQVFGRNAQHSTSHGLYDVLSDALLDLVDAGAIARAFYAQLVFPLYFRSEQELIAPVQAGTPLAESWRLERSGTREVPVPFQQQFERDGDRAGWAASYTNFLRAFTEPIVARQLEQAGLAAAPVVEQLYRRVEERLNREPSRYPFHFISIAALLTRV